MQDFTIEVREKIKKKFKVIEDFSDFKSYEYFDDDNKKVMKINDNIIAISKGLGFTKFLSYFQTITKNEDVFRGFKKIEELYPGYKRNGKIINEIEALRLFEKNGSCYFKVNNPMEFIANAQHFGLPTRLVDFTENPFIALFFSMYQELDKDEEYYYLIMAKYNENMLLEELPVFNSVIVDNTNIGLGLGNEDRYRNFYKKISDVNNRLYDYFCNKTIGASEERKLEKLIDEVQEKDAFGNNVGLSAKKGKNGSKILFVEPNYICDRIKNQQGLFMYPYVDDVNMHLNILAKNTRVFAIHKSYRDDIKEYLDRIGVTEYKLMPDLSSVCSEIINELS